MTISVCVAGLVADGKISKGKAQEAEELYSRYYHQLKGRMGMMAAASEATDRAIKALDLANHQRKRVALLQVDAQKRWLDARIAESGEGRAIQRRGAEDHIRQMEYHRQGVANQAFGMIDALLRRHRQNAFGQVRNKSDLTNVLSELMGRETGDINAREIADAWIKASQWLRSRFNDAGGAIGHLEEWGAPQSHDMAKVRDAGLPAWKAFITPLLDKSKMIDRETGMPMTDDRLDAMLDGIWETIATDGWSKNNPGVGGMGSIASRRSDPRVLHFATPEGWLAYSGQFGGHATLFDTMVAHVHGMARDIAAMEYMGPNPSAALQFQKGWLEKSAALALAHGAVDQPGVVSRALLGSGEAQATADARGGAAKLERLWNEFAGNNSRSENPRFTLLIGALGAQQAAAKLGSAVLKSTADFGSAAKVAAMNDLPVIKMLATYLKLMLPDALSGGGRVREQLARAGVISEEWTRITSGQYQLTGEEITAEWARRLANFTIKASLLSRHTEALQLAFAKELLSAIATHRDQAFGALDGGFARMMQRYGIDEARWDLMRQTQLRDEGGAPWIFPEDMKDQALADDVMRMLASEGHRAVITPDLDTRALINRMGRGSVSSELWRSAFMFKSFPLSMMSLHGREMMRQAGIANRVKYGLTLVGMSTIAAAFGTQLWNLAKGRDPEDMTTGDFWKRQVLSGGGLGIYGDLIKSSENRFGGSLGQTLLGPVLGGTASNLFSTITYNAEALLDGDPETQTQVTKDLVGTVLPETPGLSLWYIRLAMDRLMLDQLREWANPDYAASYRKMQDRAAKDGTRYWSPPGSRGDFRLPDFGNAIGRPDPANQLGETLQ